MRTVRYGVEKGWKEFFASYPRRQSWGAAEKAYRQLYKRGRLPALEVMAVAIRCQQAPGGCLHLAYAGGRSLVPLPASWLNAERWHDEFTPPLKDTANKALGYSEARPPAVPAAKEDEDAARQDFFARFGGSQTPPEDD